MVDQSKVTLRPLRLARKYETVTGVGTPPSPAKKSLKLANPVPVTVVAVDADEAGLLQVEELYFWTISLFVSGEPTRSPGTKVKVAL